MSTNPVLINLVVAHGLEAKPLISQFELRQHGADTNVYVSDAGVRLLLTGMGRKNVEYVLAKQRDDAGTALPAAWLNIGIAGHQRLGVGETLLANKISGAADQQSVYPTPLVSGLQTGPVITVDEPELAYPEDAAYDMEAFAFWRAAASLGPLDLVQSFKLISDNPDSGTEKVTPALISELFAAAAAEIERLTSQLKEIAATQQAMALESPALLHIKESVRLSVTQEIQVRRLCQRFHALGMTDALQAILDDSYTGSRALIAAMQAALSDADWREDRFRPKAEIESATEAEPSTRIKVQ